MRSVVVILKRKFLQMFKQVLADIALIPAIPEIGIFISPGDSGKIATSAPVAREAIKAR